MSLAVTTVLAVAMAGCGSSRSAADVAGQDAAAVVPADWTVVDDEPSGVSFALPSSSEPAEAQVPAADGEEVTVRNYVAREPQAEVGFNILDVPHGEYSLDAGVQSVASSLDGTVEDAESIDVGGHDAVQGSVSFGDDNVALFQLILIDDHVLQPLVAGESADREQLDQYFDQLVGSVDAG